MSPTKYVYDFSEGNASMKSLLGGKGANLAEMTGLGIPVPPGFIVTTAACVYYSANGAYPAGLTEEIEEHLRVLEKLTGKTLGDPRNPLLLSIRSGAVFSMPGMMDTVLNLGLNDETVEGLAQGTGNPRFAYDSYRRFISMFGDVVMGVDPQAFEDALTAKKAEVGAALDTDLSADDLRDLTVRFKQILGDQAGEQFPADPLKQLHMAVVAVFKSWDNHRAKVYRRTQGIPDDLGTAVNVQTMVFGNKGRDIRDRRGFHPRPLHRGELLLRGVPDERPGRGRGGRRAPSPPVGRDARGHASRPGRALRDPGDAGEALPGHAGRRVHHRGRQALHAADA